jgi:hypothetical protein
MACAIVSRVVWRESVCTATLLWFVVFLYKFSGISITEQPYAGLTSSDILTICIDLPAKLSVNVAVKAIVPILNKN